MSRFEELDSENSLPDPALQELESQLSADADHLENLYPSMHASKLGDLVSRCLVQAHDAGIVEAQSRFAESQMEGTAPDEPVQSGASAKRSSFRLALKFGMAVCLSFLLIGTIVYLNRPHDSDFLQPMVSKESDSSPFVETTPVSINQLPPEFLNASQPELEALYDLMPNENVSVEF